MASADRDRKSGSPDADASEAEPEGTRRKLEKLLGDRIRRAVEMGVEAGIETLSRTDGALRGVADAKLPREVVSYVFSQIDETKSTTVRVLAREFRDFLDKTDLAIVLRNALTSLSFEIRTEIRFIPNEKGTGFRPSVKARATSRRRGGGGDGDADSPDADADPKS